VLSNFIWNQNKTHEVYGGIVPELGARRHLQVINLVIKEALQKLQKRRDCLTELEKIELFSLSKGIHSLLDI
jgi:N6-L-threonylcarbamoyladenine synthase